MASGYDSVKSIVRTAILTLLLTFLPGTISAASKRITTDEGYWKPVIEAIIYVESRGEDKAKSGRSVGAMQITPILVAECNDILKKENSPKRYSLKDRYNRRRSIEMFLLIQKHQNESRNIEQAIRSWNGGPHYKKRQTDGYYRKVMAALKEYNSK